MRTWPALEIRFDDPDSDELLQAALLDFNIAAVEETTLTAWRVFFLDGGLGGDGKNAPLHVRAVRRG